MLALYHSTFYIESSFRIRDLASWSFAGAFAKAVNLLWVGVPIFFVVSGYCIAASVESLRKKPHSLKTYVGRRVWRIYPPLWFACLWAILCTATVSNWMPDLFEACLQLPRWENWSLWTWLGNFTATESWRFHVAGGETSYLMTNTWTLCFEEQFYIVVGLILTFASSRPTLAALMLCGFTLVCRHLGRAYDLSFDGLFCGGHWLLFAAGILVFFQIRHATRRQWWALNLLYLAGMVYAVIDRKQWAISDADRHLDEYLFVSCSFAILLLALRRWDSALTNFRILQPLRWCGKRSYSIYLVHYPVVVALSCYLTLAGFGSPEKWLLVTLPVCLAASLICGEIFYRLVERHFLNAPSESPRPA